MRLANLWNVLKAPQGTPHWPEGFQVVTSTLDGPEATHVGKDGRQPKGVSRSKRQQWARLPPCHSQASGPLLLERSYASARIENSQDESQQTGLDEILHPRRARSIMCDLVTSRGTYGGRGLLYPEQWHCISNECSSWRVQDVR